ncbi:MAG: hypothetical protein Q8S33_07915 [Myxococcales bacterium]|nr:hypothetical protein [Myxococcales bacterium]MDP3500241.1 hypothetical protein [Myxococcales bacterium]
MTRLSFVALLCAGVISCSPPVRTCTSTAECGSGQSCVGGQCRAGAAAGGGIGNGTGGGNASAGGSAGGGTAGGRTIVTGCDPMAADNATRDTDCDGLSDQEEYGTDYGNNARTDPCNSDSDGDGLPDGLEMGKTTTPNAACGALFQPDTDPASKTNPTQEDTDGDGLKDGVEDTNQDGARQATETNPLRVDTDCDGYSDKEEVDGAAGCATNPTLKDTDSDGLPDGVEGKLVPPGADPRGCNYAATTFDADTSTGSNACSADTDGDGIADGAEDTNSNGRVDMGELNPNDSMDAMGPAQQACSTANLRPVSFHTSGSADVQVALVPEFMEVAKLTLANDERGIVFFNPVTKVGGIAISKTMGVGATPSAEEATGRSALAGIGTIATPLTQTYTSWDGFAGVRATYDVSSNRDAKDFVNELARRVLGQAAGGLLMGTGGTTGPFKVQAVYVRRTATRAVTVIAAIPTSLFNGAPLFQLDDVGGGTAVSQSGDLTATQCETFTATANAKVDFLWVVDDSCSMDSSQDAVRNAGALFGTKLASAGLDWRAAAVTTGYYSGSGGSTREWTAMTTVMSSWFDRTSGSWFGLGGSGSERGFPSARAFIERTGPQVRGPFRADANPNLIFLSDTGDQSNTTQAFGQFLTTTFAGRQVLAHAIACPAGMDCGDGSRESTPPTYGTVVQLTGGVLGTIQEFNVTNPNAAQRARQETIIDAILSAAIGGTGRQLNRPPISATIKVAIEANGTAGACNTADVPRSRMNGWDIDSATRRIVFYGTCRPTTGRRVAVSYRYWIDNSPDANGDPCGGTCVAPFMCDPNARACVCMPNCGNTCGTGLTCKQATCACEPGIE